MFGLSWKKKVIDYALKDYAKSYDFEDSGFFTSQLTIKNVELNSSCLDNFSTPFNLKRGVIGSLELTVPWGNLTKQAIQAMIHDVHIILEPRQSYNIDEVRRSLESEKRYLLKILEAEISKKLAEIIGKTEGESTWSYISVITEHFGVIVPNVCAFIRDLNICIVDVKQEADSDSILFGINIKECNTYPYKTALEVYRARLVDLFSKHAPNEVDSARKLLKSGYEHQCYVEICERFGETPDKEHKAIGVNNPEEEITFFTSVEDTALTRKVQILGLTLYECHVAEDFGLGLPINEFIERIQGLSRQTMLELNEITLLHVNRSRHNEVKFEVSNFDVNVDDIQIARIMARVQHLMKLQTQFQSAKALEQSRQTFARRFHSHYAAYILQFGENRRRYLELYEKRLDWEQELGANEEREIVSIESEWTVDQIRTVREMAAQKFLQAKKAALRGSAASWNLFARFSNSSADEEREDSWSLDTFRNISMTNLYAGLEPTDNNQAQQYSVDIKIREFKIQFSLISRIAPFRSLELSTTHIRVHVEHSEERTKGRFSIQDLGILADEKVVLKARQKEQSLDQSLVVNPIFVSEVVYRQNLCSGKASEPLVLTERSSLQQSTNEVDEFCNLILHLKVLEVDISINPQLVSFGLVISQVLKRCIPRKSSSRSRKPKLVRSQTTAKKHLQSMLQERFQVKFDVNICAPRLAIEDAKREHFIVVDLGQIIAGSTPEIETYGERHEFQLKYFQLGMFDAEEYHAWLHEGEWAPGTRVMKDTTITASIDHMFNEEIPKLVLECEIPELGVHFTDTAFTHAISIIRSYSKANSVGLPHSPSLASLHSGTSATSGSGSEEDQAEAETMLDEPSQTLMEFSVRAPLVELLMGKMSDTGFAELCSLKIKDIGLKGHASVDSTTLELEVAGLFLEDNKSGEDIISPKFADGKDYLLKCVYNSFDEKRRLFVDATGIALHWSRTSMYEIATLFEVPPDEEINEISVVQNSLSQMRQLESPTDIVQRIKLWQQKEESFKSLVQAYNPKAVTEIGMREPKYESYCGNAEVFQSSFIVEASVHSIRFTCSQQGESIATFELNGMFVNSCAFGDGRQTFDASLNAVRVRDERNKTIFQKQRKKDPLFMEISNRTYDKDIFGINSLTSIAIQPFEFTMKPSFLEALAKYFGEGLISDPSTRQEKVAPTPVVGSMSLSKVSLECKSPRAVLPAKSAAHPGMFISATSFKVETGFGLDAVNPHPAEDLLGLSSDEVPSNITDLELDGLVVYDIVTQRHIIDASLKLHESYPLIPSLLYWNVSITVPSVELVASKVSLESIAEVWPPVWNYIYDLAFASPEPNCERSDSLSELENPGAPSVWISMIEIGVDSLTVDLSNDESSFFQAELLGFRFVDDDNLVRHRRMVAIDGIRLTAHDGRPQELFFSDDTSKCLLRFSTEIHKDDELEIIQALVEGVRGVARLPLIRFVFQEAKAIQDGWHAIQNEFKEEENELNLEIPSSFDSDSEEISELEQLTPIGSSRHVDVTIGDARFYLEHVDGLTINSMVCLEWEALRVAASQGTERFGNFMNLEGAELHSLSILLCHAPTSLNLEELELLPVPILNPVSVKLDLHSQEDLHHSFDAIFEVTSEIDLCLSFNDTRALHLCAEHVQKEVALFQTATPDTETTSVSEGPALPLTGELNIQAQCFSMEFVNDAAGFNRPLFKFQIEDIDFKLGVLPDDALSLGASFAIKADYFNRTISLWEPLLEKWILSVEGILGMQTSLEITSNSNLQVDLSLEALKALQDGVNSAQIYSSFETSSTSFYPMDIKSPSPIYERRDSRLDSVINLTPPLTSMTSPENDLHMSKISSLRSFIWLRNNTGTVLRVFVHENYTLDPEDHAFQDSGMMVPPGQTRSLELSKVITGGDRRGMKPKSPFLSLFAEGPRKTPNPWLPILNVSMDELARSPAKILQLLPTSNSKIGSSTLRCTFVNHQKGKLLTLASTVKLYNETTHTLAIKYRAPYHTSEMSSWRRFVPCRKFVQVPVFLTGGYFLIKPNYADSPYAFCKTYQTSLSASEGLASEPTGDHSFLICCQLNKVDEDAPVSKILKKRDPSIEKNYDLLRRKLPTGPLCFFSANVIRDGDDAMITLRPALRITNFLPGQSLFRVTNETTRETFDLEMIFAEKVDLSWLDPYHALSVQIQISNGEWSKKWTLSHGGLELGMIEKVSNIPVGESHVCMKSQLKRPGHLEGGVSFLFWSNYWFIDRSGMDLCFKNKHRQFGKLPKPHDPKEYSRFRIDYDAYLFWQRQKVVQTKLFEGMAKNLGDANRGFLDVLDNKEVQPCHKSFALTAQELSFPPKVKQKGHTLSFRVYDSEWSEPINIAYSQTQQIVLYTSQTLHQFEEYRYYLLGINVEPLEADAILSDPYSDGDVRPDHEHLLLQKNLRDLSGSNMRQLEETTIVQIVPRFVLTNNTCKMLEYKYSKSSVCDSLESGRTMAISCFSTEAPTEEVWYQFRLFDYGCAWSQPVLVSQVGEHFFRMHNAHENTHHICRLAVVLTGASFRISAELCSSDREASTFPAPYRIENRTLYTLSFYQRHYRRHKQILLPHQLTNYAWDQPDGTLELEFFLSHKDNCVRLGSFPIEKVGFRTSFSKNLQSSLAPIRLTIEVKVEGTVRVLCIENSGAAQRGRLMAMQNSISVKLMLKQQLSVSIIDSRPSEVLNLTVEGLNVDAKITEQFTRVSLQIQDLQLDNQVPSKETAFPVIFGLGNLAKIEKPILRCEFCHSNDSSSVYIIENVFLEMNDLQLNIDIVLVRTLLNLIHSIRSLVSEAVVSSGVQTIKRRARSRYVTPQKVEQISSSSNESMGPPPGSIYIKRVDMRTVHIDICSNLDIQDLSGSEEETWSAMVMRQVGNVDNASLRLDALRIDDIFGDQHDIIAKIWSQYKFSLMKQLLKLLGSVKIVGNPTALIASFSRGFYDLLYYPVEGFRHNPWKALLGLGKGTSSLFSHHVYGTSNTISLLSSSLSSNISAICLQVLPAETWRYCDDTPANLGVASGLKTAFTCMLTTPYTRAQEEGVWGLAKGVCQGAMGSVAIPVMAASGEVARVSSLCRDAVYKERKASRKRAPRILFKSLEGKRPLLPLKSYPPLIAEMIFSYLFEYPEEELVTACWPTRPEERLSDYWAVLTTHALLLSRVQKKKRKEFLEEPQRIPFNQMRFIRFSDYKETDVVDSEQLPKSDMEDSILSFADFVPPGLVPTMLTWKDRPRLAPKANIKQPEPVSNRKICRLTTIEGDIWTFTIDFNSECFEFYIPDFVQGDS